MSNFWAAVLQAIDFIEKSMQFYVTTEQGQKEFADIFDAWNGLANSEIRERKPSPVYVPKSQK